MILIFSGNKIFLFLYNGSQSGPNYDYCVDILDHLVVFRTKLTICFDDKIRHLICYFNVDSIVKAVPAVDHHSFKRKQKF